MMATAFKMYPDDDSLCIIPAPYLSTRIILLSLELTPHIFTGSRFLLFAIPRHMDSPTYATPPNNASSHMTTIHQHQGGITVSGWTPYMNIWARIGFPLILLI